MQSLLRTLGIVVALGMLALLPASGQVPGGASYTYCYTGSGAITVPTNWTGCPSGGSASPVTVAPTGKTTTEAKVTISVTNTYQQALAASASRGGCTLQYIAVAGTIGYVFFGATPADTTTSWQLTSGQSINCAVGGVVVATDAIQVTGTATDKFIISNQ